MFLYNRILHFICIVGLVLMSGLLLACGTQTQAADQTTTLTVPEQQSAATEALLDRLRDQGMLVEFDADRTETTLFPVTGIPISINGEPVTIYEFASTEAAIQEADAVKPDGTATSQKSVITWEQPPHFYQQNQFIVVYAGSNEAILLALQEVLGAQFAGKLGGDNILHCMDADCGGLDK